MSEVQRTLISELHDLQGNVLEISDAWARRMLEGLTAPTWSEIEEKPTFSGGSTTLTWGTSHKIATVAGNDVTIVMPANPNTDHYAWSDITGKPSTFPPVVGSGASDAAAGNHTHGISIATDSGTNQLTMAANTKYKLTAGGQSYIFTTPPDSNTTYSFSDKNATLAWGTQTTVATVGGTDIHVTLPANPNTDHYAWSDITGKPSTFAPTIGTTASTAAAGDHTHTLSIATDSGTNQLTMAANTQYKLTAGGQSYIFTTPPDANSTYEFEEGDTNGTFKVVYSGGSYPVKIKGLASAAYTGAADYASVNHTHGLSMATDSGTSSISLAANTKYKLTAGGSTYIFTTPPDTDTNTWRPVGTGASDAAAGNHTHGISIATDSGTNQLTMAANTKYKLTAGGQSYIFTTPPDSNTTYSFSDKNVTLAWGTKSTIATVGGTDIHVTMPANPNTDHYAWSDITGKPSTFTPASHTHNYAGSSSAGGAATSLVNFTTSLTSNLGLEITANCIGYVSGLTKDAWNYQQTDGAIYGQFYNSSWKHEIYADYRTGQISLRGKNNGMWQSWRRVVDSSNYTSIISLGSCSGLTKSQVTTALGYTPPTSDTNTWRPVGTGASDAAAGNHTHGISIATDSGTNQLTMAANTKYKLTAGGQSYIFTTPPDNNTTYSFSDKNVTLAWGTKSTIATVGGTDIHVTMPANPNTDHYAWSDITGKPSTFTPTIGTTATTAAAGNHSHGISIATDSGTNQLTMAASTKYKLIAGGSTYIFTTPPNTTYSFSDKNVTLAWGTKSTIATVGGTDIHVTMPANPNTDHYAWSDITGKPSTYAPTIGTSATTAAAGNHSHAAISSIIRTFVGSSSNKTYSFTLEDQHFAFLGIAKWQCSIFRSGSTLYSASLPSEFQMSLNTNTVTITRTTTTAFRIAGIVI